MEGAPALERALPADGPQPLLRQLGRRLAGRLHDDDHGARAARARRHAHRLQRRQHARQAAGSPTTASLPRGAPATVARARRRLQGRPGLAR